MGLTPLVLAVIVFALPLVGCSAAPVASPAAPATSAPGPRVIREDRMRQYLDQLLRGCCRTRWCDGVAALVAAGDR
ncbi:hypothetical protein, partial [Pseudonocardia sp. GCM10023141]|uniref:hypothetical protein n=1 Tax=Pseudonocardia sp. GCM10023141 TaxID=3252653 RepID=UPI0036D22C3D